MFKLVGKETFMVGGANTKATINIEAVSGFAYEYSLNIAGKSLQKFIDNRAKTTKTWLLKVGEEDYRVVLGELTLSGFYLQLQAVFAGGNVGEDGQSNLLRVRSV